MFPVSNTTGNDMFSKDPLIRRFISASFFAVAFVWVAVHFFDVDLDVVWVLLIFSFMFVGALIVIGLLLTPIIRLLRRRTPFLSSLEKPDKPDKPST